MAARRPVRRADELPAGRGDPRRSSAAATWTSGVVDAHHEYGGRRSATTARRSASGSSELLAHLRPGRSSRSSSTCWAATTRRGSSRSAAATAPRSGSRSLAPGDAARRAVHLLRRRDRDGRRQRSGVPRRVPRGRGGWDRELRAFVRARDPAPARTRRPPARMVRTASRPTAWPPPTGGVTTSTAFVVCLNAGEGPATLHLDLPDLDGRRWRRSRRTAGRGPRPTRPGWSTAGSRSTCRPAAPASCASSGSASDASPRPGPPEWGGRCHRNDRTTPRSPGVSSEPCLISRSNSSPAGPASPGRCRRRGEDRPRPRGARPAGGPRGGLRRPPRWRPPRPARCRRDLGRPRCRSSSPLALDVPDGSLDAVVRLWSAFRGVDAARPRRGRPRPAPRRAAARRPRLRARRRQRPARPGVARVRRLEPARRPVPARRRVQDPRRPLLLDVRLDRGGARRSSARRSASRAGRRGGAEAAAAVVQRRDLPPLAGGVAPEPIRRWPPRRRVRPVLLRSPG